MASGWAWVVACVIVVLGIYNISKLPWYVFQCLMPSYGLEASMPLHCFGLRSRKLISDPILFLVPHTVMGVTLQLLMALRLTGGNVTDGLSSCFFGLVLIFVAHAFPERRGLPNRVVNRPGNELITFGCCFGVVVGFSSLAKDEERWNNFAWWVCGVFVNCSPVVEWISIISYIAKRTKCGLKSPEGDKPWPGNSGYECVRKKCCPFQTLVMTPDVEDQDLPDPLQTDGLRTRFGLVKLLHPLEETITPEDYLAAVGEWLGVMAAIAWSTTYLFNPGLLESNPLKDVLGYNNICVAWDAPPAQYVTAPLCTVFAYLGLRFAWTDAMRTMMEWDDNSHLMNVFFLSGDVFYALAMAAFPLLLALTPDKHAFGHTAIFFFFIICRVYVVTTNFVEHSSRVGLIGWAYLAIYIALSVAGIINVAVAFRRYDDQKQAGIEQPEPSSPFGVGLSAAFDWIWIVMSLLSSKFLPRPDFYYVSHKLKKGSTTLDKPTVQPATFGVGTDVRVE